MEFTADEQFKPNSRQPSQMEAHDRETAFGRWRLNCPYGMWTCADGREVLFNLPSGLPTLSWLMRSTMWFGHWR